jgi:glycosyltransferase involved in cell wall biosynthesis
MMEQVSVGIVTPRFPPNGTGGGEVSAALLARVLSERPLIDDVIVYTFDGDGPNEHNGATIKRYNSPSIFSFEVINTYAYLKLRRELSQDNVDILHSYNMRLHPVVGHLSNKLRIPSVGTLNSYAFIPYDSIDVPVTGVLEWYKKVMEVTTGHILFDRMRLVDSFIAISSAVGEIYRKQLLPEQNISVIPNMYEPEFSETISHPASTPFEINSNHQNILYVGSLRATKGVRQLIRAAELLPERFHIIIAGGGESKERLQSLAEERGVESAISLLGRVPHKLVMSLYSEADMFIHPGIWPEPFGRTILEAMQFGLPVVATNTRG